MPKNVQKVLLSAHVMRVSVSRMRLSPSWLQTCCCLQGGRQDLTNLIMSTTSNQAEGLIFLVKFIETFGGHSGLGYPFLSFFQEIPGGPKCTFSSSKTFKLMSGEHEFIQRVS